jgi:4-hydroxythreonine-4-phosphate dehydrogenase
MEPLVLTMGEPAGIGGDIALAAWLAREERCLPCFFIIDDCSRLARLARRLNLPVPLQPIAAPEQAHACFPHALPVMQRPLPCAVEPGHPNAAAAPATIAAIEEAVRWVHAGRAAALVTNPIHKAVLYDSGFRFPGHTEFLADLAQVPGVVMMLTCPLLKVVPVTIHLSLCDAIAALSMDAIVAAGRIAAAALTRDFGLARPRVAVAGLNPHAGEAGSMGREDLEIVAPAVAILRREGIDAVGPLAPDTMFHAEARATYDLALCQYHDQALIPLKTLDFYGGVNVTLGLPFIRTSPDHGTAFDMAGSGKARPDSLIAALRLAAEMAARRA